MKTIGAIVLVILLTAYLWIVVALTMPAGSRPLVWTVAPATSAPLSSVTKSPSANLRMFGGLEVCAILPVGEGSHA